MGKVRNPRTKVVFPGAYMAILTHCERVADTRQYDPQIGMEPSTEQKKQIKAAQALVDA